MRFEAYPQSLISKPSTAVTTPVSATLKPMKRQVSVLIARTRSALVAKRSRRSAGRLA